MKILGWFYFERRFFLFHVVQSKATKLNSMRHMLCGANNTTRPGNLRATTRKKCQ